jgi:ribosomal protein L29
MKRKEELKRLRNLKSFDLRGEVLQLAETYLRERIRKSTQQGIGSLKRCRRSIARVLTEISFRKRNESNLIKDNSGGNNV